MSIILFEVFLENRWADTCYNDEVRRNESLVIHVVNNVYTIPVMLLALVRPQLAYATNEGSYKYGLQTGESRSINVLQRHTKGMVRMKKKYHKMMLAATLILTAGEKRVRQQENSLVKTSFWFCFNCYDSNPNICVVARDSQGVRSHISSHVYEYFTLVHYQVVFNILFSFPKKRTLSRKKHVIIMSALSKYYFDSISIVWYLR
jgi:hypothetical protein